MTADQCRIGRVITGTCLDRGVIISQQGVWEDMSPHVSVYVIYGTDISREYIYTLNVTNEPDEYPLYVILWIQHSIRELEYRRDMKFVPVTRKAPRSGRKNV